MWLPPGYVDSSRLFPVVYGHDGQNLFDPSTAFVGIDWQIHDAVERMAGEDERFAAIVVAVWNTADRVPEYMPAKPLSEAKPKVRTHFQERYGKQPISDQYLRFLVEELKPEIDKTFRTDPQPSATTLLGSSMGGLISLYGMCEYPEVFGNAVCMSSSWTIIGKPITAYLRKNIPAVPGHRVYFDHGNEAQIGAYEKIQHEVDLLFHRKGYRRDVDFMTQRFPGDTHSEEAWRDRVSIPLRFILSSERGHL